MTRVPVDRAQAHTADRGGEAAETCLPTTPPPEVRSRFVLAAARMVDVWLHAGQVRVSTEDFRIVRDFLERDGWTVEELPGVCVRLRSGGVPSAEMTREAAALVALRRLVAPSERRRRALRTQVEDDTRTVADGRRPPYRRTLARSAPPSSG
jgi:hypothetical protein